MISSFNNFPALRFRGLVPIIFTEGVVAGIRLLISKRREAGVLLDNTYIFPLTNSRNRLRGWDKLQSISKKINKSQKSQINYTDEGKKVTVNYLATTQYVRIRINMGN